MHNFLKQKYGRFSLITTDKMLRGVLQVYAEQGISVDENPILTIGNPRRLSAWERRETYLAPLSAEHIALEATRLFTDMYSRDDFSAYVELDVEIESRDIAESANKELWDVGATPQREEIMKLMQKTLGKKEADRLRKIIRET